MDKTAKILIFVALGILLFSFKGMAEPNWVNDDSILNNSKYNPDAVHYFYINWTDSTGSDIALENVIFETNLNGSIANFTSITIPAIYENTSNTTHKFYINWTQNQIAGANIYWYRWYAKNNTDVWSNSTNQTYNILKADNPIRLFLGEIEDSRNFTLYENVTFNASLSVFGKNINLNSTLTGWTTLNNDTFIISNETNLSTPGLFSMTAYFSGDQNYYYNSTTYYIGVTPYSINNKTRIASGSRYVSGEFYQFNITWIGVISKVNFETDFNGTMINYTSETNILVNNDTNGNYWINFTDLPAKPYKYRWYANTSYGWFPTPQFDYVVSTIPLTLTFSNNNSWTVSTGTGVRVICTANDSVNLTLSIASPSSISYSTTLGTVSTDVSSSIATSYVFTCSPVNTNYSGYNTATLTYQTTTNPPSTQNPPSSTPTGSFTITGLPSTLSVNAGESKATSFDLKNTLGYNLLKTNISLTGIDSSWYSFSSASISSLMRNVPEKITLTFNIPSNAEAKEYTIKVKAEGGVPGSSTKKTAEATMKLTVVSTQTSQNETVTENQTINESLNQTNQTTNQTAGPTGLSIRPEDISNIVLIAGFICSSSFRI